MLSGLACPGPGAVSAGAGSVLVLLLHAYTLAAFGDSSPSRLFPSVYASFRQSFRLSFVPPCYHSIRRERARRSRFCFALSLFSLVYPPFSSDIPLLFVLFTCYSLSECLFYCILFYAIAARLIWARAPLCVLIAGFSPGRVVRCIMSAFSRGRSRI